MLGLAGKLAASLPSSTDRFTRKNDTRHEQIDNREISAVLPRLADRTAISVLL
jgi:hypothetical protein